MGIKYMKSEQEYRDSIRQMRPVVYAFGHGAEPTAVQRLVMRQSNNIGYFKERAKNMAGIK